MGPETIIFNFTKPNDCVWPNWSSLFCLFNFCIYSLWYFWGLYSSPHDVRYFPKDIFLSVHLWNNYLYIIILALGENPLGKYLTPYDGWLLGFTSFSIQSLCHLVKNDSICCCCGNHCSQCRLLYIEISSTSERFASLQFISSISDFSQYC